MMILRCFLICFFTLSLGRGEDVQIKKGGTKPNTFTYEEALEMLKARDAQWEGKLEKADSLIEMYKSGEEIYEDTIFELEEYAKVDSVLSAAKSKQIELLQSRDKTNQELIKTLEPKWYQNQYLWLGIGFIIGSI